MSLGDRRRPELIDPPLTALGRKQAIALQPTARATAPGPCAAAPGVCGSGGTAPSDSSALRLRAGHAGRSCGRVFSLGGAAARVPPTRAHADAAIAARSATAGCVVVSPMVRATQTALLAYGHLVGKVPWVAHEVCVRHPSVPCPGPGGATFFNSIMLSHPARRSRARRAGGTTFLRRRSNLSTLAPTPAHRERASRVECTHATSADHFRSSRPTSAEWTTGGWLWGSAPT